MSYKIITDSFFETFSKINYLLLTEINIKDNNFLEKLNEEKKKHILKCYLERLIYDDMYKHLTLHFPKNMNTQELTQNIGHLLKQNYYNHFLGEDIKIELFYDNLFPSMLNVYYFKNNVLQRTERFLKSTYIDDYGNTQYSNNVYCTKIEDDNEVHFVQSF